MLRERAERVRGSTNDRVAPTSSLPNILNPAPIAHSNTNGIANYQIRFLLTTAIVAKPGFCSAIKMLASQRKHLPAPMSREPSRCPNRDLRFPGGAMHDASLD